MHSLLIKTPKLVHWLFPKRVWAFSRSQPTIYLTFDDGPIPEVTPWVLEQLRKYDARATFFCIGENIAKYPEIAHQIIVEGHAIANHTFHHKNGWKTNFEAYVSDFEQCKKQLEKCQNKESRSTSEGNESSQKIGNQQLMFRPPYGKMTSRQAKAILKKGHHIIMWDVLSGDYDQDISEEKCLDNVLKNIQKGSIVVFHDSLKAERNLKYVLPKVLEHIKNNGWNCEAIT